MHNILAKRHRDERWQARGVHAGDGFAAWAGGGGSRRSARPSLVPSRCRAKRPCPGLAGANWPDASHSYSRCSSGCFCFFFVLFIISSCGAFQHSCIHSSKDRPFEKIIVHDVSGSLRPPCTNSPSGSRDGQVFANGFPLPMHTHTRAHAKHACLTELEWRPSVHSEELRVLLCQHATELI